MAHQQNSPEAVVTVENFPRAESDMYFTVSAGQGGFGAFHHHRDLMPIDHQSVVRANRDTLYSDAVLDLDAGPATVTLPDPGRRFLSMILINEDHYCVGVEYGAGSYRVSREQVGTRYVLLAIRTMINPATADDAEAVHALQDAMSIDQPCGPGQLDLPPWDHASQKRVRGALVVLGEGLPDLARAFGSPSQVDPVRHLIASASAWGGNPDKDATYLNVAPERNDGETVHRLTVRDVPVDGFWSISVYNRDGYFEPNSHGIHTVNNLSAKRAADGSITVQFGGTTDDANVNVLPVPKDWNYMVRLYRPRPEVLDGTWRFPLARPA
ncbi:DUF1254 domain-containing protein [Streptomyces sp. H27-H1]|uniref:DUF1254 domain-containing protein n=1 Tax=Streptomyces sp. H27-H1 TaxID=2996461 RepID=UPI00226DAC7F|nr:DUF1254 domain-containing protein [Streptomyces sp. H27-H1]MCY0928019.1 DUF1254 domain-containing protein [Streptomyces sp. H27-H1]